MRRAVAVSAAALLVCLTPAVSAARLIPPQSQTEQIDKTETFMGTILSARQKGNIANPYIVIECSGDDGQKVSFNIKGKTVITDVDGKTVRTMSGPKKGHKVEIKYAVSKGQNEAISVHYLD